MKELYKNIMLWQKKNSERRKAKVFIVEGIRMFLEAPEDRIMNVIVSESFAGKNRELIKRLSEKSCREHDFTVDTVQDSVFERLSDTKNPQGILAVLKAFDYNKNEVLSDRNGMYLLLENLQDPGNLGTVFRSAEATGVSGIIMSSGCVDIYNPKVIRSTMGAFFRVKFLITDDLQEITRDIQKTGGKVYAAHLMESSDYDRMDYRKMMAFMIGNEAAGLSRELASKADSYIKIPMEGSVESLNAAMAATVLMFEAYRQRRNG